MFKYAQIDVMTGRCQGVSFLSAEVIADHMILLTEEDEVNPRDTYDNGTWTPAPPIITTPDGPSLQEQIDELTLALADIYANGGV